VELLFKRTTTRCSALIANSIIARLRIVRRDYSQSAVYDLLHNACTYVSRCQPLWFSYCKRSRCQPLWFSYCKRFVRFVVGNGLLSHFGHASC